MTKVYCRGCGRYLARSTAEKPRGMYCLDSYCPLVPPATDTDGLYGIVQIQLAQGNAARAVAIEFGISHQRVWQIGRGL